MPGRALGSRAALRQVNGVHAVVGGGAGRVHRHPSHVVEGGVEGQPGAHPQVHVRAQVVTRRPEVVFVVT